LLRWLGQAHALVTRFDLKEAAALAKATQGLAGGPLDRIMARNEIPAILYRALAWAEIEAPAAVRGAFIPAGNAFDALAAFGNAGSLNMGASRISNVRLHRQPTLKARSNRS
jgi:hypothetical protein